MVALWDEALQEIKNAYNEFEQYKQYITEYNVKFVEWYVWASSAMIWFWPWKLKWVKSVDRVVAKVNWITKTGKLISLLKPIKSIDAHVFEKHKFWSLDSSASTFLEWADIEKVIKEWYSKQNKKIIETISKDEITGKTFDTLKIELDMWKIIWQSNKKDTQFLRIIVDYDWNVISSYPIGSILIK